MTLAGCGGGGDGGQTATQAAAKGPPSAQQVQRSVVAIIETCTKQSFDASVDTGPVSAQVDRLIALWRRSDPDAKMAPSDLKATTLREALGQVRDQVRACSPADEERLNDTLTSSPAPAGAATAAPDTQGSTSAAGAGGRGVATIAAELAPLCVHRIESGDTGPATPQIKGLVDDLIAAYRAGPKNTATALRMRIARTNLADGCGPTKPAGSRTHCAAAVEPEPLPVELLDGCDSG